MFLWVINFFVSALALKLSLNILGQPSGRNRYKTALKVALGLAFAGWVLGFVPFLGWLLYAGLWVFVIRDVYGTSWTKTLGVALLQVVVRLTLLALLGWLF